MIITRRKENGQQENKSIGDDVSAINMTGASDWTGIETNICNEPPGKNGQCIKFSNEKIMNIY